MQENIFYVYALLDPRKPGSFQYRDSQVFDHEPFYIGKGKGNRCKEHYGYIQSCKYKTFIANKIRKIFRESGQHHIILKVYENLFECQAFSLETFLINQIGRKDLGLGPLCNHTDGGEGSIYISEETRIKKRNSMLGKNKGKKYGPWRDEVRKKHEDCPHVVSEQRKKELREKMKGGGNPFFNKTHTVEAREKMSISRTGLKQTPETISKRVIKLKEFNQKEENRRKGKRSQPRSEEAKRKTRETLKKKYEQLNKVVSIQNINYCSSLEESV